VRLNFTPPLRHRERPDPGLYRGLTLALVRRSDTAFVKSRRNGAVLEKSALFYVSGVREEGHQRPYSLHVRQPEMGGLPGGLSSAGSRPCRAGADTAPYGARPGRARDTVGIERRAAGWDWLERRSSGSTGSNPAGLARMSSGIVSRWSSARAGTETDMFIRGITSGVQFRYHYH